jgi:uncharacterized protein with FMN-binding domain
VRRALPAIVITVIGLIALVSFKTSPGVPATQSAATAPPNRTNTPPAAAPPTPNPSTTTAPGSTRTVEGDAVDNPYGTVQVRVTLRGNEIVDVQAVQMPMDRPRSAYISEQAGPYLQQEVLQAQSAQIDIVSGATYTSDSYAQSLQSALDRARG